MMNKKRTRWIWSGLVHKLPNTILSMLTF